MPLRPPPTARSVLVAGVLVLTVLGLLERFAPPSSALSSAPLGPPIAADALPAPAMPGRIAYARTEGAIWNLFVSDPNGENEMQVTHFEGESWPEHVRWSDFGTALVYDLYPGDATYRIAKVDTAAGIPTPLAVDGQLTDPAVSPVDGRLAFARRESQDPEASHDIVQLGADQSWAMPTADVLTALAGVDERGPDWSPDGFLVYERRAPGDTWDVWVIDDAGNRPAVSWPGTHERAPRWSPDGGSIAFISGPYELGLGTLYVMDLSSQTAIPLVSPADGPLVWAPSGDRLLFHNPRIAGPVPAAREETLPADSGQVGLHLIDIASRQIWRLSGAAGGAYSQTLYGGYSPDWWAPSPTPSPTPTATATSTSTPRPALLPWTANKGWLGPEPTATATSTPTPSAESTLTLTPITTPNNPTITP